MFYRVIYKDNLFNEILDYQSELKSNLKIIEFKIHRFHTWPVVLPLSTKEKSSTKTKENDSRISFCLYLLPESTVVQVITKKQSQRLAQDHMFLLTRVSRSFLIF